MIRSQLAKTLASNTPREMMPRRASGNRGAFGQLQVLRWFARAEIGEDRGSQSQRIDADADFADQARFEAENAFSLSLVRARRVTPQTVGEQKSQMLKKRTATAAPRQRDVHRPGRTDCLEGFLVAGYTPAAKAAIRWSGRVASCFCRHPAVESRSFARRWAMRSGGRPTVSVDIGRLMGSLVGQSQANMRQTLHMLDAMAFLFLSSVEKSVRLMYPN
jgi:hypothetical protein